MKFVGRYLGLESALILLSNVIRKITIFDRMRSKTK